MVLTLGQINYLLNLVALDQLQEGKLTVSQFYAKVKQAGYEADVTTFEAERGALCELLHEARLPLRSAS